MSVHLEPEDMRHMPAENCVACGKPTRYWADPHTPCCEGCAAVAEAALKAMQEKPTFIIKKEQDDPIALRASIGGTNLAGYYCVYRGDRQKVMAVIRKVLEYMEKMPPDANDADSTVLGS